MSLPEQGTPEATHLIELYQKYPSKMLNDIAKEYGYQNGISMCDMIRRKYNVVKEILHPTPDKIASLSKETQELFNKEKIAKQNFNKGKQNEPPENIIVNLPEIKIKPYVHKPKDYRGDTETQVLQLSDGHAGKITKSYNDTVYAKRMNDLFEEMMIVTELHRKAYDINKLVIINTGDNVQGENPYQGSRLGTTSMGAADQVIHLALPAHAKLIMSLRQEFPIIEIHCYPGNHGMVSREAPETSNWDLMLYSLLREKLERYDGIKIISHESLETINIDGFKFLCFHGDEVKAIQGIPIFALSRRIDKWFQQFKGFNYAIGSHFRSRYNAEISSAVELFLNGTLVSDDDWALKKIGVSSVPQQWTFGIHPLYGVTWRYRLIEKEFAPEKYEK